LPYWQAIFGYFVICSPFWQYRRRIGAAIYKISKQIKEVGVGTVFAYIKDKRRTEMDIKLGGSRASWSRKQELITRIQIMKSKAGMPIATIIQESQPLWKMNLTQIEGLYLHQTESYRKDFPPNPISTIDAE